MRLLFGLVVIAVILTLAAIAYVEQDAILVFIEENLRSLPSHISALLIVAWVGLGTVILIPNTVLFVTSGTLFGFWWAFTFNIIGFGLGSTLAFLISRYGFYEFVRARTHTLLQTFNQRFSDAGWKAVAVVRLIPVFPSFTVNYLLGITHVKFFDYVWASIVFTLPACIIFTYLGDVSIQMLMGSDKANMALKAAPLIIVGVVVLAVFRRKLRTQKPD